jgi:hypothetical protein
VETKLGKTGSCVVSERGDEGNDYRSGHKFPDSGDVGLESADPGDAEGEGTTSRDRCKSVWVRWDQSGVVGVYRVRRSMEADKEGQDEPVGTHKVEAEQHFFLEALTEGEGAKMEGRMVCYESTVKRWLRKNSLPALWLGTTVERRSEQHELQERGPRARMKAAAATAAAAWAESIRRAESCERHEQGEIAQQLAMRERLRLKEERRQGHLAQAREAHGPEGEGLVEEAEERGGERGEPEQTAEEEDLFDMEVSEFLELSVSAQELNASVNSIDGQQDASAAVGNASVRSIVPPPPPPKDSYNAQKRGKQVLKHRKEQAALVAAAAAAEAEAFAAQITAAYSLAPVLKARHRESADMKLFLVRTASSLLCQRMSEAAVFHLLHSSSDGTLPIPPCSSFFWLRSITPLFARHRGCARLREHLALVFLSARMQRRGLRRAYSQATEAAGDLRRVTRARIYRDQHDALKGLCAVMYMAPRNHAFQEQRGAAVTVQAVLRVMSKRLAWCREVEAAVCMQKMVRRPLAVHTYPRWIARASVCSAVLRRMLRAKYRQHIDAAQTLASVFHKIAPMLVRRRLRAGEMLAMTMVRLALARESNEEHGRALLAARRIDVAAAGMLARRRFCGDFRAALVLSASTHQNRRQEWFLISQVLHNLVLRTGRDCVQDAALVLQAAVTAALFRAQTMRSRAQMQGASTRLCAAVRAWRVRELDSFANKKAAACHLQLQLGRALNRTAETGVRFFVKFLWRRVRRTMMVRRIQRVALQARVRHPFSARFAATIHLQARIKARRVRGEYTMLARGWRRRAELDDKRLDKRQKEEAEDAHALRVAQRERERQWVSRSLEEEAVEETVLLETGEVLSSRVLSHEEYMRSLGLSGNIPQVIAPAAEMRLVVQVVSGKALTAMDRGETSDPYAMLEVGAVGVESKDPRKKCRSKVIKATVNPQWKETLEVIVSAQELAESFLNVRVWDKDLLPGADDLIGRCVIPLAGFSQAGHDSSDQWYTIYDDAKTVAGYINLVIALLPVLPAMSLTVEIVEARGLKAMDRGGTSDPYLIVTIRGGQQKDKRKSFKSQVVPKSLCPKWNESCELPCDNYEINNEHVLVQIYDKDLLCDDLIGQTSLDLASILRDTELHVDDDSHQVPRQWYTIYDPKTRRSAGEVLLRLTLAPASVPMIVTVRVVAGKGLKAMDRGGTSDPYVVVQIGEKSKDAKKKCQTKVVQKNLDPSFNETFELSSSKSEIASETVRVLVYDKDLLGADDLIGQVTLPLASAVEQGTVQADGTWHTILDSAQAAAGQVLVSLTAAPHVM